MKNKRNEEGLIVKTETGNGPHAPVVRPEEEHEPEGGWTFYKSYRSIRLRLWKLNTNSEKSHKSIRFLLVLLIISDAKRTSWKKPGFFIKENALNSRYGAGSSLGRTTGALPVTSRPKIAMSTLTLIGKMIENEINENENTQQQNNENMKKSPHSQKSTSSCVTT